MEKEILCVLELRRALDAEPRWVILSPCACRGRSRGNLQTRIARRNINLSKRPNLYSTGTHPVSDVRESHPSRLEKAAPRLVLRALQAANPLTQSIKEPVAKGWG